MYERRIKDDNSNFEDKRIIEMYSSYAKFMRDEGWYEIDLILDTGISKGGILEVGSGPGIVGLEICSKLPGSTLTGYEMNPKMVKTAETNALEYQINAKYIQGNAEKMAFDDSSFDSVISNASLHEWNEPNLVFNEIYRVLKKGGNYCIIDLRRDVEQSRWDYIYKSTPEKLQSNLVASREASYTKEEIEEILSKTDLKNGNVKYGFCTISAYGKK